MKRRNPRAGQRGDSSEVMAELVSQLRQQLEEKSVPATESGGDERDALRPNLDRLTVGVDLCEGDQPPEAHHELFRDWQRTQTQSSGTALRSPRLQIDVWFCSRAGTTGREATNA